jgi:hypothetical protein
LDRRLGGPQNWYGRGGEEKNSQPLPELEPPDDSAFRPVLYKTVILPVVLYGCDTWSVILMKEHRLRVFENWVLSKILGPNRDEATGGCIIRSSVICMSRK